MGEYSWSTPGLYNADQLFSGMMSGTGASFSQNTWDSLANIIGYEGEKYNFKPESIANMGLDWSAGEGNWSVAPRLLTDAFKTSFAPYQFKNEFNPDGAQTLSLLDSNNNSLWSQKMFEPDNMFDSFINMAAPAVFSGMLGGALSPMFGGGLVGGALGGGVASGATTAGLGGDFGKGFIGGAIGGGLSSFNPAQYLGISDKILGGAVNSTIGGTLGGVASGQSLGDSFTNSLQGAALGAGMGYAGDYLQSLTSGAGSALGNIMGSIFGNDSAPASTEAPLSSVPSMNASYPEGTQSLYQQITGNPIEGTSNYAMQNASYPTGSLPVNVQLSKMTQAPPPQKIQSLGDLFANPSLSNLGQFAMNNAGTLGRLLYGIYNTNRQKKQLNNMMANLNGLYNPGGKYATQLRGQLAAKDAAAGRRSNYAGRETQLMADLAGKNAALMPAMSQMQMNKDTLNNKLFMNTLASLDKLGAFKGLGSLFGG